MTCAIASIATAVPETTFNQHEALKVARSLGCPSPEQDTWLPGMYAGTLMGRWPARAWSRPGSHT
jgi:hypothetical protein